MAEEQKNDKPAAKDAGNGSGLSDLEMGFVWIGGALAVLFLLNRLIASVGPTSLTPTGFFELIKKIAIKLLQDLGILPAAQDIAIAYVIFTSILCLFFIVGITYSLIRIIQIWEEWNDKLNVVRVTVDEAKPKNPRWQRVLTHINSDNPSNWRLAVLEADIVLDDLLDSLGYAGSTIGEKLKQADPARFRSLQSAWEAHKIRNAIAHEGQDFELSLREARRIIALYKQAFDEFDFV